VGLARPANWNSQLVKTVYRRYAIMSSPIMEKKWSGGGTPLNFLKS
jgi:hypothetical protein